MVNSIDPSGGFPSFDGLNPSYVVYLPSFVALASDDNATSFISCCVLGIHIKMERYRMSDMGDS